MLLPLPPTPLGLWQGLCPAQDGWQPMCFHPQPLPVPNSQVITQGRRGGGALEGKRAWMPKNIKSQGGPGQRYFCRATLHLPSTHSGTLRQDRTGSLSSAEHQGSKATRVPGTIFCLSQAGAGFASLSLSVPIFKLEILEAATVCSGVQGQRVMKFTGPCSEMRAKQSF